MNIIIAVFCTILCWLAIADKARPKLKSTETNEPLDYDQLIHCRKSIVWFEPLDPEVPHRAGYGTLIGGRIYFRIAIPGGPHQDIRREDIGKKYNVYIRRHKEVRL